ncbi:uncharacterized protein LOC141666101 isoform X2 [Apium graveolens]|uniref:uncharacterized protein LOC141666101 isoform X2 n=1 Tax=Apium graveolens TaxID=4045 RepID=UPI003D7B88BF
MMKKRAFTTSVCSITPYANFISHSHLSTNPNNPIPFKPKPHFPFSFNPPPAKLPHLLLEKSKLGFDDALVMFDQMLHLKPLPNVIHFNQLLAALVKMKQHSVAVSLFRNMCATNIPLDIFTFNTAINCFCHLNRVDYAFSLLPAIIKRGFLPDVVTYTTLIRGLISQDNPVEAQNIFNKLLRFNDIQPNVVTYTTIIDGLCKRGHPSVAVKLFRYMEKKGCKPNAVTYNTIIDCLRKCRLVDQALGLLREMTRKGILPNLMTYSSLIQGLFDFNRWQDINGLLREMDISNISPDVHTFSILVDAYGKEGMIKDAEYFM